MTTTTTATTTTPVDFSEAVRDMQVQVFRADADYGVWGDKPYDKQRPISDVIAQLQQNIGDVLLNYVENGEDEHIAGFKKVETSLASLLANVLSFAEAYQLRVTDALVLNLKYDLGLLSTSGVQKDE